MVRFIIFVILCFCIGCTSNNKKAINNHILNELNETYDSVKVFFGKELTNHFPSEIDKNNITFTEGFSPDFGNLELILINKIDNTSFKSTLKKLESKTIATYDARDTCLLVVNRFANKENYYRIKVSEYDLKLINRDCYSGLYPVPNFWHNKFTTAATDSKLPLDFKIHVIEADSGKYLDKKYLTNGAFMPDNWKNGYSKGYAISSKRNVIIYWLIIW